MKTSCINLNSVIVDFHQDELKELKLSVGAKIDSGNRMLGMDYVPRDESGTPIDSKTAGVMHLYKVVSY